MFLAHLINFYCPLFIIRLVLCLQLFDCFCKMYLFLLKIKRSLRHLLSKVFLKSTSLEELVIEKYFDLLKLFGRRMTGILLVADTTVESLHFNTKIIN